MDAIQLYKSLMASDGPVSIKATWIERFIRSPISFYCDLFVSEEEQDSIDAYTQHLFQVGQEHQSEVVQGSYSDAIQQIFFTEEEGFQRTLELMVAGERSIKNMPLIAPELGLEGRPDLLLLNDSVGSRLGPFSYSIIEIKSAKNIREFHILQATVYNRLLGHIQGYEPTEFVIINRDQSPSEYSMDKYAPRLDQVLSDIRSVVAGKLVPAIYGTGEWPWEGYVDRQAIKSKDVSLIPGVGPAVRPRLAAAGFPTHDSIAKASADQLTQIQGIGATTANKMITSSQAIVSGSPIKRGTLSAFDTKGTEVFFDFEGTDPRIAVNDGLEVINYLIGAVVRVPESPVQFIPFFASGPEDEEANLRLFINWANQLDDPVFYHWHHYELTHLKKMVDHYGVTNADKVIGKMVDLSPITTKAFAFPAYGEGLKDIAKALGFRWRQEDVQALESITLYLQYIASDGNDEQAKRKILDYNEDDCLATMYIFDWLSDQS